MLAERHHGLAQRLSSLWKHLRHTERCGYFKPCTPKPDQITIDLTSDWMVSCDVCRLGHCGDSCQKFFSVPTRFLSLGQKSHRKAKIDSRSFQNLNQQLQITQTTELFDPLPIETKTTCHSLHVICVISISFISLSPGKSVILLDHLNHI